MLPRLLSCVFAVSILAAADWTFYRTGPFEVHTDRDKKQARETLNHFEQLRWVFAQFTGKQEPRTLWPVRIIVTRGATWPSLRLQNDAWVGLLSDKDTVPVAWTGQFAQILVDDNLGRMPPEIERGFISLLSTAEVSGPHVILGQAPPQPDLDWARLHLLATSEDYRGRLRPLIANLEKGIEFDVALRNAFGKPRADFEREAAGHLAAKVVPTADIAGKPVNINSDFTARDGDDARVARWLATPSAADTAIGLHEAGKFDEAIKLKPDWPLPYRKAAAMEADAGRKAGLLKKAAELSPRDAELWIEFATLMTSYQRFADADKAWASAFRAATDAAERERIRARRNELTDARLEAEEQARREAQLAKEREIQRLKNEAIANIRALESKANAGQAPRDPNQKLDQWWEGARGDQTISGTLTRVDCQGTKLTLHVASGGKTVLLKMSDPSKVTIAGSNTATLACGVQRPARALEVEYFSKTSEVAVIRFK